MQNPSINEAIVIEVIILSGIGSFLAAGAIVIVVISQSLTTALVVATVMPDTATIRNPSR